MQVQKYVFGIDGLSDFGRWEGEKRAAVQSWALPVFFSVFNDKKWLFCTIYQVNNLFLHQSYLKSPLSVKLTW